jgi:hypothetical protein
MYNIRLNLAEAFLFNGQFLLIVFMGASAVMAQELSIGLLLAFIAYAPASCPAPPRLIDQIQQWRLVGVHLDRLSDIVVQTPEPLVITPREELLPGPRSPWPEPHLPLRPFRPADLRGSGLHHPGRQPGGDHRPSGAGQDHFHAHAARPAPARRRPAADRRPAPDSRHRRRLARPHRAR